VVDERKKAHVGVSQKLTQKSHRNTWTSETSETCPGRLQSLPQPQALNSDTPVSAPATSPWTNSSTLSGQPVNPDRLYWDKLSGTSSRGQRHRLAALLHYARPGDATVVIGIDRLGRNAAEVTAMIRELRDRDIVLRSLRDGIDTSNSAGRMVAVDAAKCPGDRSQSVGSRSRLHPITRPLKTPFPNTSQQLPNSPNTTHYHSILPNPSLNSFHHKRLQRQHTKRLLAHWHNYVQDCLWPRDAATSARPPFGIEPSGSGGGRLC
jgi:hypothetical protein